MFPHGRGRLMLFAKIAADDAPTFLFAPTSLIENYGNTLVTHHDGNTSNYSFIMLYFPYIIVNN